MAGPGQGSCWVCNAQVDAKDNYCRSCGAQLLRIDGGPGIGHALVRRDARVPIGVFLLIVGAIVGALSYFMGIVPMLAFGLASLLIGSMVLYLPSSDSVLTRIVAESSLPSLFNIERLLDDLDLDERGIYIPVSGFGVAPRVLVPLALTPSTRKPPLGLNASRRMFVTVGKNPEDRGILLDSPGAGILSSVERSLRLDLSRVGLTDLQGTLDSGFRSIGIGKVTSVRQADTQNEVRIEMQLTALIDLEAKVRNSAPRLSEHIGTPVASALAGAVSKATARYVKLRSSVLDRANRRISVRVQLVD